MSVHLSSEPDDCWWCGEPFPPGAIVVFWCRFGSELMLHPHCAEDFGATLIFESRRAGMIERGQNPLSGIVARSPRNGDPKVVELRRERGGR
jgi:hypothetical protein